MPEHSWRERTPRSTCETPWSTFRKAFLTDELLRFAVREFNHYPKTLAAMRDRPHYVRANLQWPPAWVGASGRLGPMNLTTKDYLKYIAILYLLGAKGLQNSNLDDLFSSDPVLREEWLCKITNRHDLGRFLRQVRTVVWVRGRFRLPYLGHVGFCCFILKRLNLSHIVSYLL